MRLTLEDISIEGTNTTRAMIEDHTAPELLAELIFLASLSISHETVLCQLGELASSRDQSIDLTLDVVDSLGEVVDVGAGNTGDGDTAILGEVDRVVLSDLLDLLSRQAGVGEHADLGGDVGPVVLGAELLELLAEESAHGDDAIGHALDLTLPLRVELGVVEDLGGETGTVDGRVGVHRTDDDLEL